MRLKSEVKVDEITSTSLLFGTAVIDAKASHRSAVLVGFSLSKRCDSCYMLQAQAVKVLGR
jgi:hypothetical protein